MNFFVVPVTLGKINPDKDTYLHIGYQSHLGFRLQSHLNTPNKLELPSAWIWYDYLKSLPSHLKIIDETNRIYTPNEMIALIKSSKVSFSQIQKDRFARNYVFYDCEGYLTLNTKND